MKFLNEKMKKTEKEIKRSWLGKLILPEFYEINNCVHIMLLNKKDEEPLIDWAEGLENNEDRMKFEWNANSAEYEDFIKFNNDNEKMDFGFKLVEIWKTKLKEQFPNYNFIIVLSFSDNSIIRFNKLRVGTTNYIDEGNIESFKNDGILVEKFGPDI